MTLDDYLKKKKIPFPQAALELGCTRGHLWRIRRRWCRPRPELAEQIVAWTGGKVTLGDLMDVVPDRPRRLS